MQQTRERETTQQSRRAGEQFPSHVKNYDNVVGVLCCYKAPAWTVVEQSHARQFARYSSDFHKNRPWVAELKMLAESLSVTAAIFLGMQLLPGQAWPPSLSSHGTSGLQI